MGYKRLLLVEGYNDQYVLRGLLRKNAILCAIPRRDEEADDFDTDVIVIDQAGSVERLLERLEVTLDDGDLMQLGVIVDADTNVGARWDALCGIFARFGGVDLPKMPASTGTLLILQQPYRVLPVGVWIMPNNQMPGILEDFVSFLIPDTELLLWEKAQGCVDSIPTEQRHFSDVDVPKAQIHTWLAWQEQPGQQFGIAVTARYLDANAPYALMLVDWVKRVFELL